MKIRCFSVIAFFCVVFLQNLAAAGESRLPLSRLDLGKMSCGALTPQADKNLHGEMLRIGGRSFAEGVGTHADSDFRIAVNGAKRFVAAVGVDGASGDLGSIRFRIFGDDKLLWQSSIKRGGDPAQHVDLPLEGIKVLDLAVSCLGDINSDRANWVDAAFFVDGENPVALDLPAEPLRKSKLPFEAAAVSPELEQRFAKTWFETHFLNAAKPLFSFKLGERPFAELCDSWKREVQHRALPNGRTEHTITYTDPASGLVVRAVGVEYSDFPAVEWTLWLKNEGKEPTPAISGLQAVDTTFFQDDYAAPNRYTLYHFKGDHCTPDSYEALTHCFEKPEPVRFFPSGGRPTDLAFPYYKLQGPDSGMIFVVSWQGEWESEFAPRDGGIAIRAGQQLFDAKLQPGEEIRTPMIFCLFYQGDDYDRSQNLWRHWFLAHNIPRVDGKLIEPFFANYSGRIFVEMERANEANQKAYADLFLDHGIKFDYLWMDAGWYPCERPDGQGNSWVLTGTWKPDPKRFPNGLRAISDYVHEKDVKTIVWFEPERVMPGTELATEHAGWLLGKPSETMLLNLGDPAARVWMTNRLNDLIKSQGIDLYRQDFNIDPLEYWRNNDAPDRQGMTENLYCQGYLTMWDGILAANPGIIIDSCSSGGRRNDLETMRRALPLHKTDYNYGDLTAKHALHHTLFQWLPFFGSMNWPGDLGDIYYHRSAYALAYHGSDPGVFEPGYDFAKFRRWMDEWREIAPLFYGDFYPLSPYSRRDEDWVVWQFHLEEKNAGLLQAFRHPKSPFLEASFKLKGLEPDTVYNLKNFDDGTVVQRSGRDLMDAGITLRMEKAPDSALFKYWK